MRTIPPEKGYLDFREITKENDVLLGFDEVICARVSKGGAQEYHGVTPDLTALARFLEEVCHSAPSVGERIS
jgi:glutamate-1-semialdehyde 2,1-aminomutase